MKTFIKTFVIAVIATLLSGVSTPIFACHKTPPEQDHAGEFMKRSPEKTVKKEAKASSTSNTAQAKETKNRSDSSSPSE